MHEFTHLLLAASYKLGTLLDVANVLEVEPNVVYRWIAGFDRPTPASVTMYKARLIELRSATLRAGGLHPFRRRFDTREA